MGQIVTIHLKWHVANRMLCFILFCISYALLYFIYNYNQKSIFNWIIVIKVSRFTTIKTNTRISLWIDGP
jgi:hypothetical protein